MTLLVNNFHTIYKNCPPAALLAAPQLQRVLGEVVGDLHWKWDGPIDIQSGTASVFIDLVLLQVMLFCFPDGLFLKAKPS